MKGRLFTKTLTGSRLIFAVVICTTLMSVLFVEARNTASVAGIRPQLPSSVASSMSSNLNSPVEDIVSFPIIVNSAGDGANMSRSGTCDDGTGKCTLRAAIQLANATSGTDTIQFSIPPNQPECGPVAGLCAISLGSSLPDITDSVSIAGPATNLTITRGIGQSAFRILNITAPGTVTIFGLTIHRGSTVGIGGNGGGIANAGSGTVNIDRCIIQANSAGPANSSDPTGNGGGVANATGKLNINNSVMISNFTSNRAGGAVFNNGGVMTITNSTLTNNFAQGNAGNVVRGGAIANVGPLMSLINSTVTLNSANGRGGGVFNSTTMNIFNSTVVDNTSSLSAVVDGNKGGGIYNDGTIAIRSVLVAQNNATDVGPDVFGSFSSSGFNLIGRREGSTGFTASTDQTGDRNTPLDPKLDPSGLTNTGGLTSTISLLCGSPAIDRGITSVFTDTTDQRGPGFTRTFDDFSISNATGGDGTDIGAFERQQTCAGPFENIAQFNSVNYIVQENCTAVTITVNRIGGTSGAASVDYSTSSVSATDRKDYITALGRLQFAGGETSKTFVVLINEDSFVEGLETFNIQLTNPTGTTLGSPSVATVAITDDSTEPSTNVIDDAPTYVCQHYHDFLNRQPDSSGLAFWTNEITSCGNDQQCIEIKRVNVSAAFFLSIEFQQTGYLVERMYKASFGDVNGSSTIGGTHQIPVPIVHINEFLSDTQQVGQGVIVGQGNWEQLLEANKQALALAFVQRSPFANSLPTSLTPAQFVTLLFANTGIIPSDSDRGAAITEFGGAGNTTDIAARARCLRRVAENATLKQQEFNRAFVLMQYFGYLRRNPNDTPDPDHTGFDFWLNKLNQFNGNFINAEMVRAFIKSGEYRTRFGVN